MNKGKLINVALAAMLVVGVGLLLYPTVSDWWNSSRQTSAVISYAQAVDEMSEQQREDMLAEARAYNDELPDHIANGALDDWALARYDQLLDVTGTGIMGYVEIPSLGCSLPIYHGTDEAVLQVAVGHLEWTSLPVGGAGAHAVISGHRGLPSAKLFTNLDKLAEGDTFELHVLGKMLVYEVDQIRVVEPTDIAELAVQEGRDLCTLMTCTPYGINTHRLLVRGHRVDALSATAVPADAVVVDATEVALVVGVPLAIAAVVVLLACTMGRRGFAARVQKMAGGLNGEGES